MRIIDQFFSLLTEGEQDKYFRDQATAAADAIEKNLPTVSIASFSVPQKDVKTVAIDMGKLVNDKGLEGTMMLFSAPDTVDPSTNVKMSNGKQTVRRGGYSRNLKSGKRKVTIIVDPTPEMKNIKMDTKTWVRLIFSNKRDLLIRSFKIQKSAFVHEFIHMMDDERIGKKNPENAANVLKQATRSQKGGSKEYLNSPLEFNAFFQQTTWMIRKKLQSLKTWDEMKKIIPDANVLYKYYLDMFHKMTNYDINDLSLVTKNKLKKRVYQFWNDLKQEFGG